MAEEVNTVEEAVVEEPEVVVKDKELAEEERTTDTT